MVRRDRQRSCQDKNDRTCGIRFANAYGTGPDSFLILKKVPRSIAQRHRRFRGQTCRRWSIRQRGGCVLRMYKTGEDKHQRGSVTNGEGGEIPETA